MEETKKETKFDFETLVLLIGTNPLPNYVVAEFFLENSSNLKNIFLMHSEKGDFQEGTLEQALNLEMVLKKKYEGRINFPLEKIALSDVSNATKTRNDLIKDFIPNLNRLKNFTLHLNYTGGTKVMCVHVYRFIEQEMKRYIQSRISTSFSYFDGRSFKIVDDSSDSFISNDLRKDTDISFDDILELHGFRRRNEPVLIVKYPSTMKVLQNQIDSGNEVNLKNHLKNFYEKYRNIDKKLLPENLNNIDNPVIKSMMAECKFYDDDGYLNTSTIEEKLGGFVNFFNGIWLEDYIHYLLYTGVKPKDSSIMVEKDWRIDKEKEKWKTYFQLDVILKKGFQLTGISCTVEEKKDSCKQKGFEIIHRTRQIGGDESKAIVVTFLDDSNAEAVQEELQKDSGCREGQVLVFGIKDLKSNYFIRKVREFIK
jgi:hypothetical protein